MTVIKSVHEYEVRPRKDHRGVDLISDVLPFGRLWYESAPMRTKTTGLILGLCFFGGGLCFADDPQLGIWKLNQAQSKFAQGVPKNHTVVIEVAGGNVKITVDGIDKDGKPTHNEWTGKFDGKDYPVTGDPTSDMRSYTNVANRVLKMTIKKDGKVTITGRVVVSADGKSRIVTTSEAGAEGKSLRNRSVYEKQ